MAATYWPQREKPDGVILPFGGQSPLKLARELENAGGATADAVARFGSAHAGQPQRQPDVVGHARPGHQRRVLEHEGGLGRAAAQQVAAPAKLAGRVRRTCSRTVGILPTISVHV